MHIPTIYSKISRISVLLRAILYGYDAVSDDFDYYNTKGKHLDN